MDLLNVMCVVRNLKIKITLSIVILFLLLIKEVKLSKDTFILTRNTVCRLHFSNNCCLKSPSTLSFVVLIPEHIITSDNY